MIIQIHSDASYLLEPKAHSIAGGFFLGFKPELNQPIWLNSHIHILCKILDVVCGSAVEAELGDIHLSAQTAITMRQTLQNLCHPQPLTPIHTDNKTACSITNNKLKKI